MSNTNVDLKQAVTNQDLYTVQCFVVDQQNLLLKDWLNESHQSFRATLQRLLQKSSRAKRQLIASEDEIPYQMGVWEGWLQAFRALYDEESKENDIIKLAAAKSPNTAKIIRFLYQHGQPICHGELADALGMNYSALTNAMKRVVSCGAVSASRTGRNTRYTLTPAAKQYCQKETKWEKILPKSRETILLEELIKIYQNKRRVEDSYVSVGDSVRIFGGDGEELSERKRLAKIIRIGAEKILELEPDDNNDPFFYLPDTESILPQCFEELFLLSTSHF